MKLQEIQLMTQQSPIGIFDSGVGGLSIAKTIHNIMPGEQLIYIADHQFSPYGNKATDILKQRTSLIVEYFIKRGCKAIVVACNTATVHTISYLRTLTDIPIIGVEPALKPASQMSNTGLVGLLATQQTINSDSLLRLKARFEDKVQVELVPCPLFVDLVEQGQLNTEYTRQAVKSYIKPLIEKGIDHLVLGCTHYAFLIPSISQCINELTSKPVTIIEPSMPVCLELKRQLETRGILNKGIYVSSCEDVNDQSKLEFFSTKVESADLTAGIKFNGLFSLLWGTPIDVNTIELAH